MFATNVYQSNVCVCVYRKLSAIITNTMNVVNWKPAAQIYSVTGSSSATDDDRV